MSESQLSARLPNPKLAYHVLKAHGQKLVDGDLFADIKRATDSGLNKHRTVIYEEEEEEEGEEGEEGEGEEY